MKTAGWTKSEIVEQIKYSTPDVSYHWTVSYRVAQ